AWRSRSRPASSPTAARRRNAAARRDRRRVRRKDDRIGASQACRRLATPMDRIRTTADQHGIALVLALIFSILLYVLVAERVVSGRMLRHTGENDALVARMQNQMDLTLGEVEETLLSDLASQAAAGEGGGGALPGGAGSPLPGAGSSGQG